MQLTDNKYFSEYDAKMTAKYQFDIINKTLLIDRNNELISLEFIQQFDISNLTITDCEQIEPKLNSETIKKLTINHCKLQNLDGFNLENLEILRLYSNFQLAYENVNKFKQLKELELSAVNCEDISCLESMQQLKRLNLYINKVKDISVLKQLVNLTDLNISANAGVNITPLQYMVQLTKLNMSWTNFMNVSVLEHLVNLEELYMAQNGRILDISPLQHLVKLAKLDLSSNKLKDISIIYQCAGGRY
ncbi:leucine-rich_repeat domain-containing protein [Hexamita inflata]|uniref:Leucine-rich repeat domain-containing protein n=1 Tax=Hexamita inflata TaxID=28002 RepID=A0AA86PA27_9EUKA|nr:leucine-rich repeat domain-containing protein [Hexamita inflata]